MDPAIIITLLAAALILVVALLYSSDGHGGASGYLATMALFGMAPGIMKPTALALNVIVALVSTIRFYRSGLFSWRTFWPFAVGSIPAAFLGASLGLSDFLYRLVVGLVLFYGAIRLFFSAGPAHEKKPAVVPIWIALLLGAAIGFLSGLAGLGGGIFLGPLLLLMGWARAGEMRGVVAAFVLVNSIAGLVNSGPMAPFLLTDMVYWAPAVLIGSWIGTELETRAFPVIEIKRAVSIVFIAGGLRLVSGIF